MIDGAERVVPNPIYADPRLSRLTGSRRLVAVYLIDRGVRVRFWPFFPSRRVLAAHLDIGEKTAMNALHAIDELRSEILRIEIGQPHPVWRVATTARLFFPGVEREDDGPLAEGDRPVWSPVALDGPASKLEQLRAHLERGPGAACAPPVLPTDWTDAAREFTALLSYHGGRLRRRFLGKRVPRERGRDWKECGAKIDYGREPGEIVASLGVGSLVELRAVGPLVPDGEAGTNCRYFRRDAEGWRYLGGRPAHLSVLALLSQEGALTRELA